ncbi:class F sortase [Streptomyces sp. BR123]|uniref:class F sortase n=1 Tax=Streptomyces sp. BR123 TaxID=2749828 RepID=UPI0015C4B6DD|nr:class F sortase [Streptomyces sp. BR123]NXY96545.1 class F sortase [Streptomyces sp. BR123]
MPRGKWVVGVLTAVLLGTGIGLLRSTEGARPTAAGSADAMPSRALGLSGHRRLVEQLDQPRRPRTSDKGSRPARAVAIAPLRPARPLRLRIPSLGVDLTLADGGPGLGDGTATGAGASARAATEALWDSGAVMPGAAGTAVVTAPDVRLADLRRGLTVEIPRADRRTAVFTVDLVSPAGVTGRGQRPGRAQLRLVSGETTVLARLTGQRRTPR